MGHSADSPQTPRAAQARDAARDATEREATVRDAPARAVGSFRCATCAVVFEDASHAPRCPKCLKISTVERAPEPVPVAVAVATAAAPASDAEAAGTSDAPSATDARNVRALAFAMLPALLGALLTAGWFGDRWDARLTLGLAMTGGPIAAYLARGERDARAFTAVAAMIGGAGVVLASALYTATRAQIQSVEVLIPVLLGALPGLGAHLAFRALAPRLVPRLAIAVLAFLGLVVVLASC
jgi:hypothetical protein